MIVCSSCCSELASIRFQPAIGLKISTLQIWALLRSISCDNCLINSAHWWVMNASSVCHVTHVSRDWILCNSTRIWQQILHNCLWHFFPQDFLNYTITENFQHDVYSCDIICTRYRFMWFIPDKSNSTLRYIRLHCAGVTCKAHFFHFISTCLSFCWLKIYLLLLSMAPWSVSTLNSLWVSILSVQFCMTTLHVTRMRHLMTFIIQNFHTCIFTNAIWLAGARDLESG